MQSLPASFSQHRCCIGARQLSRPASSRSARSAVRQEAASPLQQLSGCLAGLAAAAVLAVAQPSLAAGNTRLPPIDKDPNRCERAYTGNTIGQANAVADKLLDLRQCKFHGKDFSTKVLSGALMSDADLSNTRLVETVLTKVYAVGASFAGANFQNAVVDRADFRRADLSNARFINTVITGSSFVDAELKDATFEDALIGFEDVKRLCLNPTLSPGARVEVGCRTK